MNKIRGRLRKIRAKLARVSRALEIAHREAHRQYKKARHAADVRDRAKKQGRQVDARKAERRRLYHANKGARWQRRTDWLAGKRKYLTNAEKQWIVNKEAWLKKHPDPEPSSPGTTTIDGREVPNWMAPWVRKIRDAGWSGTIVSGYRSPAYSESLCFHMCGRPSCSGTCAGRASNHACPPSATCKPYEGAIDVSDYLRFGSLAYQVGAPFRNHLPYDRVHFSSSGY